MGIGRDLLLPLVVDRSICDCGECFASRIEQVPLLAVVARSKVNTAESTPGRIFGSDLDLFVSYQQLNSGPERVTI